MRHVNVKLDDKDWGAFERLRAALNKRRRQPLTISTVLRLVIRAGIEATETVVKKAAEAPIQPPKDPALHWETHVARLAGAREDSRDGSKDLYARFERRCDRAQLTPHQVAQELRAIDASLRPAELNSWYYGGKAPSDEAAAARLLSAVAKWLEAD
jgi:hypothetical protein